MIESIGPLRAVRPDAAGDLVRLGGPVGGLPGRVQAAADPAVPAAGSGGGSAPGSFLDALGDALGRLNGELSAADAAAADFAAGGSTDLHDVVLALTEAGLGLRLGVAVRDRLLEAYHDVMRLQI